MSDFRDRIEDFCVGDDVDVRRAIRLPDGLTVVEAWLTIKESESDPDVDAMVQKNITTADNPGVGQIEDDGAEGTAVLRFDLTNDETIEFEPDHPYFHDVQIKTSAGKISTPFKGRTIAKSQVTESES